VTVTLRSPKQFDRREKLMAALRQPYIEPAEYLAIERQAATKSEYVNGQVVAMAGASREHNLIAGAVYRHLYGQLAGRGCETYIFEMRVQVAKTGMYTYPDVTVVCGEPRFEDAELDTLLNPTVLVAVLSPSTEAYDRGEKFAHYRRLDSLRHYILVAQSSRRIEIFSRVGDVWEFREAGEPGSALDLPAIGCILALDDVYADVPMAITGPPSGGADLD
jgi:Uma2 family endonuclease